MWKVFVCVFFWTVAARADVKSLTLDNFQTSVDQGTWVIKFYTPWCGHCKTLAPIWDDLSANPDILAAGVNVAGVNCDEEKELCNGFHVMGYPTLYAIRDGHLVMFRGRRQPAELKKFALETAFDAAVKAPEMPRPKGLVPSAPAAPTPSPGAKGQDDAFPPHMEGGHAPTHPGEAGATDDEATEGGDGMAPLGDMDVASDDDDASHHEGQQPDLELQPETIDEEHQSLAKVRSLVDAHPIVMFSKPSCPFCKRAKEVFRRMNCQVHVEELYSAEGGSGIQAALLTETGQRTVPNIFINQKYIGGSTDLIEKWLDGRLADVEATCVRP